MSEVTNQEQKAYCLDILENGCGELGLTLTEEQKQQFVRYYEMLVEWNKVIDVGTGAGFPGIPLKIVFPHLQVTLLDSLNKRLKFLDAVIEDLGLEGIHTVHGRAEDGARRPELREQYDLSVTRAVARLCTISEYCMPYVKEGGFFVAYKSGRVKEELMEGKKAVSVLGGKLEKTEEFLLPGTDMERSLVVIQKAKPTPKKYPRKAGTPAKEPIL